MRWAQRAAVAWTTLALLLVATPAVSQAVDPNLWGTDGTVTAIARSGNTIYVGGAFTMVGPNSGGGVPVDRATGQAIAAYPRVAGAVNAVVPDGTGGWYIGGSFVAVGGQFRSNLAHILADGRVADWAPNANAEVLTLALCGQTLYVGGTFTQIGGLPRSQIASVNLTTGAPTEWNPAADLPVRALLVHRGRLYAGGDFSSIGSQARNSVAELDLATGLATKWDPDVGFSGTPGSVRALAAVDEVIYIGGLFWTVGVSRREHIVAVSATTGLAMAWDPRATGPDDRYYGSPYVSTLAVKGNTIYVGGHFAGIGGQVRGGLAQLDLATGLATAWNPEPGPWMGSFNRDVTAIALTESTLVVAGAFETMGGQSRRFAAEVSLSTGVPTEWNPSANNGTMAIAAGSNAIYVGGIFTGLGPQWQRRDNLAAFDAVTGAVKAWDPNPDGLIVTALALSHGRVFVGGYFSTIGGQVRFGLASLDTLTGAATDWNPTANSVVGSLVVAGDTLYVGGYFTTMGGQPRGRLASFDLTTGELTSWNPNAASDVYALAVRGNTVYVGGFFWTIGGVTRKGIAAVDATTGAILDWAPQTDNICRAVAVAGNTVFVGGRFNMIGGQARTNLAAIDATTGEVTPWAANANSTVSTLAIVGDTLFVGGSFFNIAGEARRNLAAVDVSTGAVLPWDSGLDGGVLSLTVSDCMLYVGGRFRRADATPVSNLAAISFTPPSPDPDPIPPRVTLAWIAPNPVRVTARARFALPSTSHVTLSVFDVQGRQVSSLLHRVELPAGTHELPLRADGWPEGFYFLRLEANGTVATRKFVVLK